VFISFIRLFFIFSGDVGGWMGLGELTLSRRGNVVLSGWPYEAITKRQRGVI